jgi:hypothetical protein
MLNNILSNSCISQLDKIISDSNQNDPSLDGIIEPYVYDTSLTSAENWVTIIIIVSWLLNIVLLTDGRKK